MFNDFLSPCLYCCFTAVLLPLLYDGNCTDNLGVYVKIKNKLFEVVSR